MKSRLQTFAQYFHLYLKKVQKIQFKQIFYFIFYLQSNFYIEIFDFALTKKKEKKKGKVGKKFQQT